MNIVMKRNIIIKISCLMVLLTLSQILYSQGITIITDEIESGIDKEIELTFNKITQRNTTGSVIVIDVEEELKRDHSSSIGQMLNGKVPGIFGNYNTWGTGNAVLLVDGIRQSDFYVNSLNPMEIESIVVLRDAMSKALYGAQGDVGVIMIKSKRGVAGKHQLRVTGQYNVATPRALPKFLNAADYMEKFSEAQLNDGIAPASLRYPQQTIDATRSGENPARYPDNDFYSDRYFKDNTSGKNVFADILGGSQSVQYYVGTGWEQNNGWLNTPQSDNTNNLNFRGNLDFKINEYMDMSLSTTARLSFNKQPNADNMWGTASTELPNNYPILWDPNLITNLELRDFLVSNANLSDGLFLGGNSSFLNNVYGNLTQNGNKTFLQRDVQFSGKLNIDLRFLTKGLSASVYGGMDFFNTLYANQSPTFAVYEPVFDEVTGVVDTVFKRGTDVAANRYNTNNANSTFFRHSAYFGTVNYNRSFGEHDVSATALMFTDMITYSEVIQSDVLFHTGFSANYMYSKKYLAEMSLMGIGSRKLKEGSRIEMTPTFGVGWILSEEDFMLDNSLFNYLKLHSSYGISKNDNWTNYNLFRSTFTRGGNFTYQNTVSQNAETTFASIPNNIKLQKRKDFLVGLEGALLNNAMNFKVEYFNSLSDGNITLMSSTYPQILGFENLVYSNYNSNRTQGASLGINYRFDVATDFSITAGSNLTHISPKITKIEEPKYEGADLGLKRKGTATDAMWALKSDGLYSEADFNADGSLVSGLPVPTFGSVRPGDIKYLDQNGDNIIDQKDQRIIGQGLRTQYSIYLDLKFKDIEFYILGINQIGNDSYRSGNYYRVFGDIKYSEMVNDAYGPNNKNVNAIHPRLSATSSSNNNRNSDYWLYKNNTFVVPVMQLTYHFSGADKASFLKNSKVYVRANNALVLGKNTKYSELNVGNSPRTRNFAIGLVT
jgi:TonB-linked SusC/RagA family outer membrane protein